MKAGTRPYRADGDPVISIPERLAGIASQRRDRYISALADLALYTARTRDPEAITRMRAEAVCLDADLQAIRDRLK